MPKKKKKGKKKSGLINRNERKQMVKFFEGEKKRHGN